MNKRSLLSLFITFFSLGLGTFGGGLAMLPFIKKQTIDKGWINDQEWSQFLAVIQITPGALAVNISHLIGYKVRGWIGGLVSVLGMVLPSLIVISLFALLFQNWLNDPTFQSIMHGVYLVVIAFLIKALIDFVRSSYHHPIAWIYGTLTAVFLVVGLMNPTLIIMVSLVLGFLEWWIKKPR